MGRADAEMSLEVRRTVEYLCSESGTSCFGDSVPIFKLETDVLPADMQKKAVARSQNVGEVRLVFGILEKGETKASWVTGECCCCCLSCGVVEFRLSL